MKKYFKKGKEKGGKRYRDIMRYNPIINNNTGSAGEIEAMTKGNSVTMIALEGIPKFTFYVFLPPAALRQFAETVLHQERKLEAAKRALVKIRAAKYLGGTQ